MPTHQGLRLRSKPALCNYYLTYRCNARCSFCDIWERPSPYASPEAVWANLRDLRRLGVQVVDFTGGEPLLHRQLGAYLDWAKQLGLITTVTTNALLYPKYAEQLRGKVDMLHFSLDFPDAERHNASRGVDCFGHVLRSIETARSLGEHPDILYTLTNDSLPGIAQVYHEITQPNGLLLLLNPIFGYNEVGEAQPGEGLSLHHHPELRWWARQPGVYLNTAFLDLREAGGNQVDAPVCDAGANTLVISPDNKLVLPCYHLGLRELPLQGDLYQQWNSAEALAGRALAGLAEGCQGCTINCYMQPSFANRLNRYFWRALPSTLKYTVEKWVYQG